MSPRTSPPQPTDDCLDQPTDEPRVNDVDDKHTAPSIPALIYIGGLFVVYFATLTALGVRRALSWPRSVISGRDR